LPENKPNRFPLIYLVLGSVLVVSGVAWIYKPAGLIVAGALLMAAAFASGRRKRQ